MPWSTPTLSQVRSLVRDSIRAYLPGADATPQNSVLRVMSDAQGALCHLTLQYIDWLSLQLLPDTAETVWLDRHGQIWLVNSDGTVGRKQATLASGTVNATGLPNVLIPQGSIISFGGAGLIQYQTTADTYTSPDGTPTPVPVIAVDPGSDGNIPAGTTLGFQSPPQGVDQPVSVVTMTGGTDTETDDELRARILNRIRQPPMGGSANDYVQWALAVPGVTRAWCSPLEMGIGTVTVRVMMDDLRADNGGFPTQTDLIAVTNYIDSVRPVAVKDFFVEAPIPYPINFNISNLNPDTPATRGAINDSINQMLFNYAAPGQTIFAAWKYTAVMTAPGVISFDLENTEDDVMPSPGHMAVLNDLVFLSPASAPPDLLPPPTRKG